MPTPQHAAPVRAKKKRTPTPPAHDLTPSLTVRLHRRDHARLRALAEAQQTSMQDVLGRALRALEREAFFDQVNAGYATLKKNPEAWAAWETERAAWDATLADGLPDR